MTAIDFPDAPTTGQVYDKWTWNGTAWVLTSSSGPAPVWGHFGPTTALTLTGAVYVRIPWFRKRGAGVNVNVDGDLRPDTPGPYRLYVNCTAQLDAISGLRPMGTVQVSQYRVSTGGTLIAREKFVMGGSNWLQVSGVAEFDMIAEDKVQIEFNADWSSGVKTLDTTASHLVVDRL